MNTRYRNWMFTINNYDELITPEHWPHIRCCVWQHEVGIEDMTPHIQGYVEFNVSMRRRAVSSIPDLNNAWLGARLGSKAQAIHYCEKPVDGCDCRHCRVNTKDPEDPDTYWYPNEASVRANAQGQRTDLHQFVQAIKDGHTNEQLVDEYAATYIRYYKGAEAVRLALPPAEPIEHPVNCIIYWGPTRTGKTHRLKQECPPGSEWFWASPGIWFDSYMGQPGIVFNEIRNSWYAWEFLLRLLDNAPRRNQTKGGTLVMLAHKFRISSNVHPKKWYKRMKSHPNKPWLVSPLRGRFSQIILMDQPVDRVHLIGLADDDEPSTSDDEINLIAPFN